jgi:LysM repeat protein
MLGEPRNAVTPMRPKLPVVLLTLVFLLAIAILAAAPAARAGAGAAAPPRQPTPFQTPTPGPDGRIIYIVQEGDSPWSIAAIAGIPLEQLYALNGMAPGDYINPGDRLVLGIGGPVIPTAVPGAAPTATAIPPTATPIFGTGVICVLVFSDTNGNARLDAGEPPLAGGQVSIITLTGALAAEYTTEELLTADGEPDSYCFPDLENGDYNVSVGVPPDSNPTTSMNYPVHLEPGDTKYLEFGAQPRTGGGGGDSTTSTLLGIIGVVMLLAGAGLGYYAARSRRPDRMSFR